MNRKWIYRAVSAAVLAGGLLFAGVTTASAGVQVAGDHSGAAPQHILAPAGFAHPVGVGPVGNTLPYRTGQSPTYLEAGSITGSTPTNGMSVDGGKLLSTAGGLTQPVQQLGGPAAGSLSGLTSGGEADPAAIPLSAPSQVQPVTEGGFTVGQNNQLPGTTLLNQVGGSAGTTVGDLVTGGAATAAMPSGTSGEDALSGANVAGVPGDAVTGAGTTGPSGTSTGQQAPSVGGDPVGTVTGLLGLG